MMTKTKTTNKIEHKNRKTKVIKRTEKKMKNHGSKGKNPNRDIKLNLKLKSYQQTY